DRRRSHRLSVGLLTAAWGTVRLPIKKAGINGVTVMKKFHVIFIIASLFLVLTGSYRAQQRPSAQPPSAQPPSAQPPSAEAPPSAQPPSATEQLVERILEREKALAEALPNYSPLVETYIQNLEPDSTVTKAPKSDKYFLGKLDFTKGITGHTLMAAPG